MIIPKILTKEITDKYNIVNNSFIRKDKGEAAEEREVEIGDVKQDDFQPQVKLKQWSGETNFSVRLKHTEKRIRIETEGDKIKWKGRKVEAHFYDVPKTKDLPKAFELEILLLEKPETNKVEFTTQSKGLKFYYQPELTQKEKDDGAFRPENVIGSYAVYHESKQGDYSKMGLKNYRAGKAFHIYRPKIIDNTGKEVWGKLNIDIKKKLLTVEIPQEFLDNAVYPVRHAAGLTFGQTDTGSSEKSIVSNDLYAVKGIFSGDTGSIVNKVTVRISASDNSANYFKGVMIESDKIISTNGISPTPSDVLTGAEDWKNSAEYISKPTLTNSATYFIGIICIGANSYNLDYDWGSQEGLEDTSNSYGNPSNPTDGSLNNDQYSIYCTYTAGGAGNLKSVNGVAFADIKSINGIAKASVKSVNGISLT